MHLVVDKTAEPKLAGLKSLPCGRSDVFDCEQVQCHAV